MMNPLKVLFSSACLIAAFNIQTAHAQTVYSDRISFDTAFPSANIENWDSYATGTVINNGSTLNGITYNTNSTATLVTSSFITSTAPNGIGETNAGFFLPGDTITFSFAQPLSAFGIDINTYATNTGDYTATLSNGDIANSFFDPFPGFGTGEFVGISDPSSFNSITITTPGGVSDTLDTLRYVDASVIGTSPVPEPSSIALMFVGLMAMVGFFAFRSKLAFVK